MVITVYACGFVPHLMLHAYNTTVYCGMQSAPFLQFQRAKKIDADLIRGRELYFGKMIEKLYVP